MKVQVALVAVLSVLQLGAVREPHSNAEVTRATLSNGLRVVIVRDPLAPVVTTVVNYLVGSDEAPAGFPGTAHAQEHMMFRGSPGLSADQLAAISAEIGGNFDADTQQSVTQYFFTVPAQDLELALHIEAIRMKGVLDTQAEWARERGAIEQEVAQDLSNPEYVFYTKLMAAMFRGTPYAQTPLGTRSSFNQTTGDMLAKFHDRWYVPNNTVLVVAGDVDPSRTLAEVKSLFDAIPARQIPAAAPVSLQPVQPQTLNLTTDLPYGLAVIAFRLPGYRSADYAAANLLADVLTSQRGALYDLVPQGKALYAGFEMSPLPDASLGYAIAALPAGGGGPELAKALRNIIETQVKQGIPASLVDAAKRKEVADAEFDKNSVSGLAMEWSNAIAVEGHSSPAEDIQATRRVTAADVDRVARQYLGMDHAITAVLVPQPSGKPVSTRSFGGRESFSPTQTQPVTLPAWALKTITRIEIPKQTVHPVGTRLSNGLNLIVQPESISDTVTVYGHIKNNSDLEEPKGQEGVGGVLDELLSYGTKTLDRVPFQKALDDIAAEESAGTDFSLKVLPSHFDRGVALLADNELHPALPPAAFGVVRKELASAQAGELLSPGYLTERSLDKSIYPPKDPTLRQATPATISSLTLEDVSAYHDRVYRPDLTTIVVIGKIDPDAAKQVIEKYFGGWTATGPAPQTDLPPVPLNKPVSVDVPDAARVQDSVTLAETLGLTRFNPDYYALQLGNHVLGGAFYATRLYRELRANQGLVYYVSSDFAVGRTRATYSVTYGCDPPNVDKARAIVERQLAEMQKSPVSDRELQQAKALLLREIPLAESSVQHIAHQLISFETIGLPLDEPALAAQRYVALTAADVQAAFARWVRPTDLATVTQGPQPR
jgi:zinc protease